MAKLFGALLIILSCTLIGFKKSASLRNRARSLADIINALEVMRSEICTRLTPMPELIERLSREAPREAGRFFSLINGNLGALGRKSFSEIWTCSARNSVSLGLKAEETEAVVALGTYLGRFEAKEQETAINRCISRMEGFLDEARRESRVNGKLYSGLGLAAGLMLTIILI